MRQGEIDNCLVMTGSDRCLFPVREGGRHHDLDGRRRRVRRVREAGRSRAGQPRGALAAEPVGDAARPASGRRAGEASAAPPICSDRRCRRRASPTSRAPVGVGTNSTAGGTIVDDFDGDGLLDIVLTSVDYCAPARLYRNKGDGTFEDRTEAAGLATQLGGLNASHADYDNDGDLDLFIHRGGWEIPMRNSLLRNDGDGIFTDVTKAAGLVERRLRDALGGVGRLRQRRLGRSSTSGTSWRRAGSIATAATARSRTCRCSAGVAGNAFTKGVSWGDYDNDGFPDLYVSNMFGDNFLYRNSGDGTFEEVAAKLEACSSRSPASRPGGSTTTTTAGSISSSSPIPNSVEEFVKHYLGQPPAAETLTLYRNDGDGGFTDVSAAMGLARVVPSMGANFGDIDNDGFLDVYLGTGAPSFGSLIPNILLRNDAGRRFDDVTEATGTGHLQKGHGVAFADLDSDGDQDIVLNAGGAVPGDRYDDARVREPGHAGPALDRRCG